MVMMLVFVFIWMVCLAVQYSSAFAVEQPEISRVEFCCDINKYLRRRVAKYVREREVCVNLASAECNGVCRSAVIGSIDRYIYMYI